ncbi:hypothetical protein AKJ09_00533 [Labilithrix luteola]|uniref:Uncharacterized protein n=1 Tax=Labilithrix luteola TaxID=1391654 RepID=A0A0K1PL76_9BACT|nr:hypothetical protein AKJ09_00533 [Labilithrix luteola]
MQGRKDGQEGGETNGSPGTACPTDAGGADTSLPPGDAQPDAHVDPDGPPLDASTDDVVDASCPGDDAAADSGMDAADATTDASDAAQPEDGGSDASDGGPSDAGSDVNVPPDASSDVTCTFTRSHTGANDACNYCVLPPEVTISIEHVPLWIDHGEHGVGIEGQGDLPPQPPPPVPPKRVIHVDAPTVFDSWWMFGDAFVLSGTPPSESYVSSNMPFVPNGGFNGTITVGSGNATSLTLNGSHFPATFGCVALHGCFVEKIACTGTGIAENR